MRKVYTWCLAMVLASPTLAQQDSVHTVLQEVVVSATRTPKEIFEIGRSVTVIDTMAIRKQAYNTVGELLVREAGIYLVGEGQTPGATQTIFMRGSNSNHTNILVDGMRLTDPSTPNSALDLSELSLANIERIEIVRGSHGAAYGTGGIGGVINIITKKGQQGLGGQLDAQLSKYSGGGYSHQHSAFINYGVQGFYVNSSLFHQKANGINATLDTVTVAEGPDKDDFKKVDFSATVGYAKNGLEAYGRYKLVDQQADIDDGAYADDDNHRAAFKRSLYQYSVAYGKKKWHVGLHGSFTISDRLITDDSSMVAPQTYDGSFVRSQTEGSLWTHELQGTYTPSWGVVTLGSGRYDEHMDLNNYVYSRSAFGVYEEETNYDTLDMSLVTNYIYLTSSLNPATWASVLNGLQVTLSGRYSNLSNGYDNFSYELSPSYTFDKTTLYASYAEGFNTPSLTQLYDPSGAFNYTTRGNDQLSPETSRTWEVGYKQLLGKRTTVTAAYYHTVVDNAIEYVYLWNGETPRADLSYLDYLGDTYINILRQQVEGVELSIDLHLAEKWSVKANGSYMDGYYEYGSGDVDLDYTGGHHVQLFNNGAFVRDGGRSGQLVRRPSFQAFGEVTFRPFSQLIVAANLRTVDSRPDSFYDPSLGPYGALNTKDVNRYTLLGAHLTYQWQKALFTTLRVENVTDEHYQEITGYSTRGRSIYLKLGYKF